MNTFRAGRVASGLISKALAALLLYLTDLFFAVANSRLVPMQARATLWRLGGIAIGRRPVLRHGIVIQRGTLEIGERFVCAWGCLLDATGRITIGDRVHMGARTIVMSNDHAVQPSVLRRDPADNRLLHTRIGRGCWIGANSMILAGVTVGEGCVIAAGSTVTRDCRPNGLYAGVPARRIRDLRTDGCADDPDPCEGVHRSQAVEPFVAASPPSPSDREGRRASVP